MHHQVFNWALIFPGRSLFLFLPQPLFEFSFIPLRDPITSSIVVDSLFRIGMTANGHAACVMSGKEQDRCMSIFFSKINCNLNSFVKSKKLGSSMDGGVGMISPVDLVPSTMRKKPLVTGSSSIANPVIWAREGLLGKGKDD
jgi:hypothetical protein